jgi:hypothetical protein
MNISRGRCRAAGAHGCMQHMGLAWDWVVVYILRFCARSLIRFPGHGIGCHEIIRVQDMTMCGVCVELQEVTTGFRRGHAQSLLHVLMRFESRRPVWPRHGSPGVNVCIYKATAVVGFGVGCRMHACDTFKLNRICMVACIPHGGSHGNPWGVDMQWALRLCSGWGV